jgi:radical SAM protein with 4Fe4S-binding SPASM domain
MYNLISFTEKEEFYFYKNAIKNGDFIPYLLDVKIKLTSRCNLLCPYCYYWRIPGSEELTFYQLKKLFEELKEIGCRKIHFSGGEVFLREDIMEIFRNAKNLGFKVCITTNGTLINKEIAKEIVKMKINSINFTLDFPLAKLHDKQKGVKGSFKKTIKAIKYINLANKKYGKNTKIRINTVITKKNYKFLEEIILLGKELGASDVLFIPIDEKGTKKIKRRLSKRQIKEYNSLIAPKIFEIRKTAGYSLTPSSIYPFGISKEEIRLSKEGKYAGVYFERYPCHAPFLHCFIGWDGSVSPCCMLHNKIPPLGNIKNNTFKEIFYGEVYNNFRNSFLKERISHCHRCDNFKEENKFLNKKIYEE